MDEIELKLTPEELRLIVRLAEANDSSGIDRRGRLGSVRLRTSLQHKLYEATDMLGEPEGEEEN